MSRQCHMQFFRQVLSPLGLYNCPVYRNQDHGRLGDKNAVADVGGDADLLLLDPDGGALEAVMCGGRWLLKAGELQLSA